MRQGTNIEAVSDGYQISLETEVRTLRRALTNLVLTIEEMMREGDDWDADAFDHYEHARAALGVPVETLPGGPEGEHFHGLSFDPEEDVCAFCDQNAQKRETKAP